MLLENVFLGFFFFLNYLEYILRFVYLRILFTFSLICSLSRMQAWVLSSLATCVFRYLVHFTGSIKFSRHMFIFVSCSTTSGMCLLQINPYSIFLLFIYIYYDKVNNKPLIFIPQPVYNVADSPTKKTW